MNYKKLLIERIKDKFPSHILKFEGKHLYIDNFGPFIFTIDFMIEQSLKNHKYTNELSIQWLESLHNTIQNYIEFIKKDFKTIEESIKKNGSFNLLEHYIKDIQISIK